MTMVGVLVTVFCWGVLGLYYYRIRASVVSLSLSIAYLQSLFCNLCDHFIKGTMQPFFLGSEDALVIYGVFFFRTNGFGEIVKNSVD